MKIQIDLRTETASSLGGILHAVSGTVEILLALLAQFCGVGGKSLGYLVGKLVCMFVNRK